MSSGDTIRPYLLGVRTNDSTLRPERKLIRRYAIRVGNGAVVSLTNHVPHQVHIYPFRIRLSSVPLTRQDLIHKISHFFLLSLISA